MQYAELNNVFQLPKASDEVVKGNIPTVMEMHTVTMTLVSGEGTAHVDSVIGKGLGEVYGIIPLTTIQDSKVLGCSVAAHSSTAGKLTITGKTSATSTASITFRVIVFGVVIPLNQS